MTQPEEPEIKDFKSDKSSVDLDQIEADVDADFLKTHESIISEDCLGIASERSRHNPLAEDTHHIGIAIDELFENVQDRTTAATLAYRMMFQQAGSKIALMNTQTAEYMK